MIEPGGAERTVPRTRGLVRIRYLTQRAGQLESLSWPRSEPDACRALQGQCQVPTPHPEAEAPGEQLARLKTGLRQRGDLTVWFSEAAIAAWNAEPRTGRGSQPLFADRHSDGTDAWNSVSLRALPEQMSYRLGHPPSRS
jgi:hypothetical protein